MVVPWVIAHPRSGASIAFLWREARVWIALNFEPKVQSRRLSHGFCVSVFLFKLHELRKHHKPMIAGGHDPFVCVLWIFHVSNAPLQPLVEIWCVIVIVHLVENFNGWIHELLQFTQFHRKRPVDDFYWVRARHEMTNHVRAERASLLLFLVPGVFRTPGLDVLLATQFYRFTKDGFLKLGR